MDSLDTLAAASDLIALGRFDKALSLLRHETLPARHKLLGAAFLGRRKAEPALHHFYCAAVEDPGDSEMILGLGRAHLIGLDAPRAVTLLEKLLLRAPELAGLAETLASAYRRDARYEDALALTERHARPSPSLLYERALCLLQLGHAEDSLANFDRLLADAPNHAAGWYWSHAPALQIEGWPAAEARLQAAIACPGANRKYQGTLAAYDILRGVDDPRSGPIAFRHLPEAAQALRPFLPAPPLLFGVQATLLSWALAMARQDGMICEFGVRRGHSIRVLAGATRQKVHGFDSFVGLPESWAKAPAGVLTTQGDLPTVPENVTLHPGWFADSLPKFLADHDEPIRFANIDCDLYSSARTVLWALADRLLPGSILVFDELIGNRSWRQDEFRALTEFSEHFQRSFTCLAVNLAGKQVAIRLDAE
jgi:tetratricopeptide (TPR) repeat protein